MNLPAQGLQQKLQAVIQKAWKEYQAHPARYYRLMGLPLIGMVLVLLGIQLVRNWNSILEYSWRFNPVNILASFVIYSISMVLTGIIWGLIMQSLTQLKSPWLHLRIFALTNLANRLPTPFPFLGARTEAYAPHGISRVKTLTGIAIEQTITTVAALCVALITLPLGPYGQIKSKFSPLVWIAFIPLLVILIRPGWLFSLVNRLLAKAGRALIEDYPGAREMFIWTGLFLLVWLNGGGFYYYITSSIYPIPPGMIIPIINIFAISGLVGWVGQVLFFVPNLALRDIAIAFLLSFYVPWPVAVAVALLIRLSSLLFEIIWAFGLNYVFRSPQRNLS